jgi:DnaK suppressor protein
VRVNIHPEAGLTQQQVEQLRYKLLAGQHEILARAAKRRPPATTDGETEGEPTGDPIDQAEATFEQGLIGSLSTADSKTLHEIDDALARIGRGTYGICEATGDPIGFDRLDVEPWARFTQAYQERLERSRPGSKPPSL